MSESSAKDFLNPGVGEDAESGYVTPGDIKSAIGVIYDDIAAISISVKEHGAVGDGVADDTAAIVAAVTAAGEGGRVYFPKGQYKVSETLWPLSGQTWHGTHTPKYANTDDPQSTCKIVAASSFTGRSLIERGDAVNGVMLAGLCFQGLGDTHLTQLDGVHLGDMSNERSWAVQDCTIHGFSGSGVTGRLHVFDMRDCHVSRNGYGLRVTGSNALTDVRIFGCQFYYNLHGGLCLDSTSRENGMVSIHGCRFERTGSTPGNPAVNRDPAAPGVRIQKAKNIDLVQCSTDANSGPGLEIIGDGANSIYTYGITVDACKFARDGGGDQSAGVQLPGVKLKGCSAVYFSSNVTWGYADDGGSGTLISPYYSVWLEDTADCRITNSWIVAPVASNSTHLVGTNSGLVTDAGSAFTDLAGTDLQNKEIRFRISDTGTGNTVTRWVTGVNPTASGGTYSLQRYNSSGVYLDSPLNVKWSDGLIEALQMYVKANSTTKIPLEVRSYDASPTVSLFKVALSSGASKLEVLYDGTLRSNWGSSSYGMTQIGSTQVVRQGASGNQTLIGAYTSTANASADSPVFEVRANGTVRCANASTTNEAMTLGQFKSVVAASTDFADFKARVAAL